MLLVPVLSPLLPPLLLPLLEREGVCSEQARFHQAVYKVDPRPTQGARASLRQQGSHPGAHLALLLRAHRRPGAGRVQDQPRLDLAGAPRPRVFHPAAHFLLLAGLLPEHGRVSRPNRIGLQERLLLLSSHLLPTEECDL